MHQNPLVLRFGERYTVPLAQVLPKSTPSSTEEVVHGMMKGYYRGR